LITPPNVVYHFWEVSPLEVPIFFAGVLVTIFTSIENGIYLTICASAALLLFRAAKAKGRFLGRVKVYTCNGDNLALEKAKPEAGRETFLPFDHQDGSNPAIDVQSPYPGIFIYRFSEGLNYPNQAHYLDGLTTFIFKHSRRTQLNRSENIGDRPWNDPGPRRGKPATLNDNRPILRAVVLDFSSVNNVDVTSVQGLIDVRNQLDRYAAPEIVEWHFASITNRWTKRALAAAGFGFPTSEQNGPPGFWKPIFSFAEIGGSTSAAADAALSEIEKENRRKTCQDVEVGEDEAVGTSPSGVAPVHGINRPFFHIDLVSAVLSAVASAEKKGTGLMAPGNDVTSRANIEG